MSFDKMKKNLIKDGFLTEDGKMTEKGHVYVESTKKELTAKTAQEEQWLKGKPNFGYNIQEHTD